MSKRRSADSKGEQATKRAKLIESDGKENAAPNRSKTSLSSASSCSSASSKSVPPSSGEVRGEAAYTAFTKEVLDPHTLKLGLDPNTAYRILIKPLPSRAEKGKGKKSGDDNDEDDESDEDKKESAVSLSEIRKMVFIILPSAELYGNEVERIEKRVMKETDNDDDDGDGPGVLMFNTSSSPGMQAILRSEIKKAAGALKANDPSSALTKVVAIMEVFGEWNTWIFDTEDDDRTFRTLLAPLVTLCKRLFALSDGALRIDSTVRRGLAAFFDRFDKRITGEPSPIERGQLKWPTA